MALLWPESGLAKIALEWMIEEARTFGMLIDDDNYDKYVFGTHEEKPYKDYVGPSYKAQQHQSLRGLWWVVEFLPQRVWDSQENRRRWQFRPRPAQERVIPPDSKLHYTVLKRMEEGEYKPANLPPVDEVPNKFEIEGPPEHDNSS